MIYFCNEKLRSGFLVYQLLAYFYFGYWFRLLQVAIEPEGISLVLSLPYTPLQQHISPSVCPTLTSLSAPFSQWHCACHLTDGYYTSRASAIAQHCIMHVSSLCRVVSSDISLYIS